MKFKVVPSTYEPITVPAHFVQKHWDLMEAKAAECNQNVFNGALFRFEGIENDTVFVSKGIDYKTITTLRSPFVPFTANVNAVSILALPITTDNKIVLGKGKFYGDWPNDMFEFAGGFVTDISNSVEEFVKEKIKGDWGVAVEVTFHEAIYTGRELETVLFCTAQLPLSSEELDQSTYDDFFILPHSKASYNLLTDKQHLFHSASFQLLRRYLAGLDD